MDRNKPGGSRSGKPKVGVPHHATELFALGSKSTSSRDDAKNKAMPSGKTGSAADRKREPSTVPLSSVPSKKPKLTTSIGGSTGPSSRSTDASGPTSTTSTAVMEYWEQIAMDCETVDLVCAVLAAIDQQDSDKVVGLVCGAIKALISPRSKPESMLSLSLLYLAKIRPHLFCNETISSALVSILRRDTSHAFKGRNNPTTHILAANLLARGYHNKTQWPEVFVRIYIDDAINERVWVDYDDCAALVENICTAFGTRVPPKSMLQPELSVLGLAGGSRDTLGLDDDSGEGNSGSDVIRTMELNVDCPTQPRYDHLVAVVEKQVIASVLAHMKCESK